LAISFSRAADTISSYIRFLLFLGGFMVVFGMMMLSLSTKYYQVSSLVRQIFVKSNR